MDIVEPKQPDFMLIEEINTDKIKQILKQVKPIYFKTLGQYTHKRVNPDWYYHSLAFVRPDTGYLFGFNIGFFKTGNINYDHIGMNVVVREDGDHCEYRRLIQQFFRKKLEDWIYQPEYCYINSERGGSGVIFPRYRKICKYDKETDLVYFLVSAIEELHPIYLNIIKNPADIFTDVVRAAPDWSETIITLCKEHISSNEI